MFGQRKLNRILAIVEDIKFEITGWSTSVRQINRRLDSLFEGYVSMSAELEALKATVAKIDQTSDALIAKVKEQIAKIDELLAMVADMSDDAEEVAALKEGIAVIRNDLQVQVEQNEAALAPPAPPVEG